MVEWACPKAVQENGEHRWEYFSVENGEEWDRCTDCGEVRMVRFHDTGSGG